MKFIWDPIFTTEKWYVTLIWYFKCQLDEICSNHLTMLTHSNSFKWLTLFHRFGNGMFLHIMESCYAVSVVIGTVYRVILARWKFWLYWRITKIRQIKKRQYFQLQNLKMSEIELHYPIMPIYFYLPINTLNLNSRYQVINTLDDHKGMLLFTWIWEIRIQIR